MELPQEAIGSGGSNCFSGLPVPGLLMKPIATCDFPGVVRTPVPPLDLHMVKSCMPHDPIISYTTATLVGDNNQKVDKW